MTASPEPKAPESIRDLAAGGWAAMSRPINLEPTMQAGAIVQDLLGALDRIEKRLARIEGHLGIKAGVSTGKRHARRGEGAGRARKTTRGTTGGGRPPRTSSYQ